MNAFNAPLVMQPYVQWIVWKLEKYPGDSKPRKIPYSPITKNKASTIDPTTWANYQQAVSVVKGFDGIGFVFTERDPFFFLDIDDCFDILTGLWKQCAHDWLSIFGNGSAVEISQSGNGLHVIGLCDKSKLPDLRRVFRDSSDNKLEFYTQLRFVAFGKCDWSNEPTIDHTNTIIQNIPIRQAGEFDNEPLPEGPRVNYTGTTNDDELIALMLKKSDNSAAAKFGDKITLKQLWQGDQVALAENYPDEYNNPPRNHDASMADGALLQHLAFWTGADPQRMEKLFNLSELGKREKWKNRQDYRYRSIAGSVGRCTTIYDHIHNKDWVRRQSQMMENIIIGDDLDEPPVPNIMTLEDMIRDLVLVEGFGAVVNRVNMRVRKKDQAMDTYIASVTEIPTNDIDLITGKQKTKKVSNLKLWYTRTDRISVDCMTWAPGRAQFCNPPEITGVGTRALNTWRGFKEYQPPSNWQEWAQCFINHIQYLIPIDEERHKFTQWLAHILVHPEQLPHTCYLFITPTTGIGRNWISSILVRVLRGYVAAGVELGKILDGSFNGRLSGKLLAVVDETREGMGEQKYRRSEALKSIVNQEIRQINPKYGIQSVEYNSLRWLMFSQHYDALPFDNNDRRIITIENPKERASEKYYTYIYSMINQKQFFNSVRYYLETYDLTGFNPGAHAPMNETKQKALNSMMSETDKAIIDFINVWPADITTYSHIKAFVLQFLGDNSVNENHLKHSISRSTLSPCNRRIKINGNRERIVIVRNTDIQSVMIANNRIMSQMIIDANAKMVLED